MLQCECEEEMVCSNAERRNHHIIKCDKATATKKKTCSRTQQKKRVEIPSWCKVAVVAEGGTLKAWRHVASILGSRVSKDSAQTQLDNTRLCHWFMNEVHSPLTSVIKSTGVVASSCFCRLNEAAIPSKKKIFFLELTPKIPPSLSCLVTLKRT